jgi:3-oxoacyl-[acyl-carrier-protein] synthase II
VQHWPVPARIVAWSRARADTAARALIDAVASARAQCHDEAIPPPPARALVVGTQAAAGLETLRFAREVAAVGGGLVNPALFPPTVMNAPAGAAAIHHDCQGPNVTLCNGATAALDALACAADLITSGRATLAFAGGFELSFGEAPGDDRPVVVAVLAAVTSEAYAARLRSAPAPRLVAAARAVGAEAGEAWRAARNAALEASRSNALASPPGDDGAGDVPGSDLETNLHALARAFARAGGTSPVLVPVVATTRSGRRSTALVLAGTAWR